MHNYNFCKVYFKNIVQLYKKIFCKYTKIYLKNIIQNQIVRLGI